jgi:hypothetical protein
MTCDENVLTALLASVNSIEEELGPSPEGIYASVRTRLDILEARINNPFAPAPNVTNPFYIGNTGVTIQDGMGAPPVTLPPAIPGSLFLREDGANNQGLYAFRPDGYWHLIDTDPFTAAGDLSGTIYSQTVIGIQGNPVSTVGPSAGNILLWDGYAWLPDFFPLNDGYVTGQLPPANIGPITLTGNVTGAASGGTISTTVISINGTSVPATPSANQVLVAASSSAAIWEQISNAQIASSAGIVYSKLTLTGDIVNTDISASAAIVYSKLNLTGSIVNTDINTSAAIAGTKITPSFGAQNISTTGSATIGSLLFGTTPNFGPPADFVISVTGSYPIPSGVDGYGSFIISIDNSTILTSPQNVQLPLVPGSAWIVQNNTGNIGPAAVSIQVTGSTGTGPVILAGNSSLVWTDGTNFYSA